MNRRATQPPAPVRLGLELRLVIELLAIPLIGVLLLTLS